MIEKRGKILDTNDEHKTVEKPKTNKTRNTIKIVNLNPAILKDFDTEKENRGLDSSQTFTEIIEDARKMRILRRVLETINIQTDLADEAVGINTFLAKDPKTLSPDKKLVYALLSTMKRLGTL